MYLLLNLTHLVDIDNYQKRSIWTGGRIEYFALLAISGTMEDYTLGRCL